MQTPYRKVLSLTWKRTGGTPRCEAATALTTTSVSPSVISRSLFHKTATNATDTRLFMLAFPENEKENERGRFYCNRSAERSGFTRKTSKP